MAKKKLNKVATIVVVGSLVCAAGGGGGLIWYQRNVLPERRKAQGREMMERGDYENAVKTLSRSAAWRGTDVELLTWIHESMMHRTSFGERNFDDARRLLDNITAVRPDHTPTHVRKLELDLARAEQAGLSQMPEGFTNPIRETANLVLQSEPGNVSAIRAQALTMVTPFYQLAASPSSDEVARTLETLKGLLEQVPNDPDLLLRYAQATMRLRDALVAERAIPEINTASHDRSKAIVADLDGRIVALLASAADEKLPAEARARAMYRASQVDQLLLSSRLLQSERAQQVGMRMLASLGQASDLVPPGSEMYLAIRGTQGGILGNPRINRFAEAEKVLRDTIAAAPRSWRPRLILGEMLFERQRIADAVEVLSADLEPHTDIVGIEGMIFVGDQQFVPLQRAFYRLQGLGGLKPEERDAAIAKSQSDYDLAVGRTGESGAMAMLVRANLQSVRQDRTGAIQTLTRALDANPTDQLKVRILQNLVSLNLALGQTGVAIDMIDQLRKQTGDPMYHFQLVELQIRNGDEAAARALLDESRRISPGDPRIALLEARMLKDPAQRRAAVSSLPENSAEVAMIKLRSAVEAGDDTLVREIGDRVIKAFPDSIQLLATYGDYLGRSGHRPRAVEVLDLAIAKEPNNRTLKVMRDMAAATDDAARQAMSQQMVQQMDDPYRKALVEADLARAANDPAAYEKALRAAEALDKDQEGTATERLFLLQLGSGKLDDADKSLAKLASQGRRDPAEIRANHIRVLIARGKADAALDEANKLVGELPRIGLGWIVKGQAHVARGQFDQALEAFESALDAQPDNVEATRGAVEASDRLGLREKLRRHIDHGLRLTRNDDYFTNYSLRYEVAFGDPIKTIEPRLKMRDANPENAANWVALGDSYSAAANARALAGDNAAAADYRTKAITLFQEASAKFPEEPGFALQHASLLIGSNQAEEGFKIAQGLAQDPRFIENMPFQGALANFFFAQRQPQVALSIYQRMVASGKAGNEIKIRLASLQADQQQFDQALATLDTAEDVPAVRELRINVLAGLGRNEDARKLADAALAKERSVPNLLLAAVAHARGNDIPRAVKLADEAVTMDPNHMGARLTRARVMMGERPIRNNDVIADLQVLRKTNPSNAEGRLLLVERLAASGRAAESMQELESLQREQPRNRLATTRLIQALLNQRPIPYGRIETIFADAKKQGLGDDPQLLSLESNVALQRGDPRAAVESARAAAKAAPGDIGLFRAFLGTLARAGAHQEVLTELDRIQGQNSSLYWTYLTRGVTLHRVRRDDEAKREFDRAMSIATSLKDDSPIGEIANAYAEEFGVDAAAQWVQAKLPGDVRAQVLLMDMYTGQQKVAEVIRIGEGILPSLGTLSPKAQSTVLSNLAGAYLSIDPPQSAKAVEAFRKVQELDPRDVMTLNNLAYAMTLPGSGATAAEAAGIARQAYELSQQTSAPNAYVFDTYGWTLILAGQVDQGLEVLRQAQQLRELPETEYHIGEALILQKQRDPALQTLQNALAIVNKLKQNGSAVDPALAGRINDAIRRAQAMEAQ